MKNDQISVPSSGVQIRRRLSCLRWFAERIGHPSHWKEQKFVHFSSVLDEYNIYSYHLRGKIFILWPTRSNVFRILLNCIRFFRIVIYENIVRYFTQKYVSSANYAMRVRLSSLPLVLNIIYGIMWGELIMYPLHLWIVTKRVGMWVANSDEISFPENIHLQ